MSLEEQKTTANATPSTSSAYGVLTVALSVLCRDKDAKCPLLALGITPPQAQCPFKYMECVDVSSDEWQSYITRNLSSEEVIMKIMHSLDEEGEQES